jgi:acetyl esterase/lipase
MPSLSARLFGKFLRLTGYVSKNFNGGPGMPKVIAAARLAPIQTPTDKHRARVDVREESFNGRAVWHLSPKGGGTPKGHLLYWHGGGYVFSISPFHWNMLVNIAEQHGIAITVPFYPLAPEAGVEDTTAFALDYYRHFIDQVPGPFVMGGDSAGGGLTAVTAMAARDAGLRLPAGLSMICPWLDAEAGHPDQIEIEKRDCILRLLGIRDAGKLYARELPVTDPRVSPIHGEWSGLPPMQVFAGGDDILVADSRALKAKQPAIDLDERAGLMHVWPIFFFPESKEAQTAIGRFVAATA